MRDGPRDECGVFGLYAPGHEVSRLSYFALFALQHRGQESAGIAAADRGGNIVTRRELGLVSQVFSENDLRTLAGELAIGHVRYSTTGSNAWENSQPVQRSEGTNGSRREVALAHNGNLINAVELHEELLDRGVTFSSTSDSEIIAAMISESDVELKVTPLSSSSSCNSTALIRFPLCASATSRREPFVPSERCTGCEFSQAFEPVVE